MGRLEDDVDDAVQVKVGRPEDDVDDAVQVKKDVKNGLKKGE